jgi:hypothetical protein
MEEIVLHLIGCQNQIRILHWQTTGDARHRALGSLYESLGDKIDMFVETMFGKYGRVKFTPEFTITLKDLSNLGVDIYMNETADYLISLTDVFDPRIDSDLLNMRDEMLGLVNHTKYLLTLKF